VRDTFEIDNEESREKFRKQLVNMLHYWQDKRIRPELRRILEGVKSNDPYTVLKEKKKRKLQQKKTEFQLNMIGPENKLLEKKKSLQKPKNKKRLLQQKTVEVFTPYDSV